MRTIRALVWAACLLLPAEAAAQGITSTPRPPSRPAATRNTPKPPQGTKPDGNEPGTTKPADGEPGKTDDATKPEPQKPEPQKPLIPKIEIHGGAWLFYYQPFNVPGEREFIRLHFAHLTFDGSLGSFGLFFNASVRDTKMREFYAGPAWIEEGYFYYKNPYITVKLGKVYSRFGLFWENSFYGNVHFYDGIKLDPNHGISLEGSVGAEKGFRFGYYGQYFLVDGRTNGSYVGRDTISIPGARRRHIVVVRAEPAYFFSKENSVALGISGQYFQADLPQPTGPKDVVRLAADLSVNVGPLSFWTDVSRQIGQSVTEYPIVPVPATGSTPAQPGRASAHNDYLLVGGEARIDKFVARYNLSSVAYRDVGVTEWLHVPAVGYNMNDYLQFLLEFAYWPQQKGPNTKILDQSLDFTIHGYF
jgi:hypothetical protein